MALPGHLLFDHDTEHSFDVYVVVAPGLLISAITTVHCLGMVGKSADGFHCLFWCSRCCLIRSPIEALADPFGGWERTPEAA